MPILLILVAFLGWAGLPLEQSSAPSASCLMDQEKERLARETNLDRRIRIYEAASHRCSESLMGYITRGEHQHCAGMLQAWRTLLDQALEDIMARPGRKDRSRALLRFEIELRRAIDAVRDARFNLPPEQLEKADAQLERADEVRKQLVKILFPE